MKQILLIVNILICRSVASADICTHLPGYTVHGTSCFKLFTTNKSWPAAEASCVADGGHLASIHSSEEQAFIANFVTGYSAIWIGITGVPPNMAWSDNTDVDYKAWEQGQPNQISGVSCGRMRSKSPFQWADKDCNSLYYYICRADIVVDQTEAFFTRIPGGVPVDAVVVPSSQQMVWSAIECATKCQQDAQCVHFVLSQDGHKYLCETYSSLKRRPTATPPTDNYQKFV